MSKKVVIIIIVVVSILVCTFVFLNKDSKVDSTPESSVPEDSTPESSIPEDTVLNDTISSDTVYSEENPYYAEAKFQSHTIQPYVRDDLMELPELYPLTKRPINMEESKYATYLSVAYDTAVDKSTLKFSTFSEALYYDCDDILSFYADGKQYQVGYSPSYDVWFFSDITQYNMLDDYPLYYIPE